MSCYLWEMFTEFIWPSNCNTHARARSVKNIQSYLKQCMLNASPQHDSRKEKKKTINDISIKVILGPRNNRPVFIKAFLYTD